MNIWNVTMRCDNDDWLNPEQTIMIATFNPVIEDAIRVCKLNFLSERMIIRVVLVGSAYVEEMKGGQ